MWLSSLFIGRLLVKEKAVKLERAAWWVRALSGKHAGRVRGQKEPLPVARGVSEGCSAGAAADAGPGSARKCLRHFCR